MSSSVFLCVLMCSQRFAINNAGTYEIRVTLLDDSRNELEGQQPFSKRINVRDGDGSWQRLKHTFAGYGPGLRFIRFEDSLEGVYSRAFAATVQFESSSTSYETMVNQQINFLLQSMYKLVYMSAINYDDHRGIDPNGMMLDWSKGYISLAEKLMSFQLKRPKCIVLQDIKKPDVGHSELVKEALQFGRETEDRLKKLRQAAAENDDRNVVEDIKQFLQAQQTIVQQLEKSQPGGIQTLGKEREVQPGSIRILGNEREVQPPDIRTLGKEKELETGGIRPLMEEEGTGEMHKRPTEPTKRTEYERAVNELINFEMQITYEFLFLACLKYSDLAPISDKFREQSQQLCFGQALGLMDFQEKRGAPVLLQDLKKPNVNQLSSLTGAEASKTGLKLAKEIKGRLTQLRSLAEKNEDPDMEEFINKCLLQRQEQSIRTFSDPFF